MFTDTNLSFTATDNAEDFSAVLKKFIESFFSEIHCVILVVSKLTLKTVVGTILKIIYIIDTILTSLTSSKLRHFDLLWVTFPLFVAVQQAIVLEANRSV